MIKIHKEGFKFIIIIAVILIFINIALFSILTIVISILLLLFFMSFFRNPPRTCQEDVKIVYAPADGKIVVIEETRENEYFKDNRIQVSIFMSVWDVHINWSPVSGKIVYHKYHPGKYLVARHPKSSVENERNTLVIETPSKIKILCRQIAGAVARKIVCYSKYADEVKQGGQFGFIKFGSRVDIFLPLNTEILVNLNQKVKGKKTAIAKFR